MKKTLILASTSSYRKALLEKIGIPFNCVKPDCDEDLLKKKLLEDKTPPLQVAEALSKAKAESVQKKYPHAIIIGGDQLIDHKNEIIGKAHTAEKAYEQIVQMSGSTHQLITSMTLLTPTSVRQINHVSKMTLRKLTENEIRNYIKLDNPLDCAGSYKIESLGLGLFEKIDTDDFSAIQGLPLIWITTQLKELGYELYQNI